MAQAEPILKRLRVGTADMSVAELLDGDRYLSSLLARADAALYRAKEGGRNRVELAKAA